MGEETDVQEQTQQESASESSTEQQDVSQESSPDNKGQEQKPEEPSMADVAQEVFDKHQQEEESASDGESLAKTSEEQEESTEEEQQEQQEENPDAQLPFGKHPRFQQVLKERGEFETRATQAELQVKELKPLAERLQYHREFCERFNIADDEVSSVMNALALRATDPSAARNALKPLWESLAEFDGDTLTPDLQQRVKDGEISAEAAKEIARLRAGTKVSGRTAQFNARQQAQQHQNQINNAVETWDLGKRKTDPDFKPRENEQAPKGLWELTLDGYLTASIAAIQGGQPNNPQLHIQMLEKAYKEAKQLFTSVRGGSKKPTMKVPSSYQNSSRAVKPVNGKPQSLDSELTAIARKAGLTYRPPAK